VSRRQFPLLYRASSADNRWEADVRSCLLRAPMTEAREASPLAGKIRYPRQPVSPTVARDCVCSTVQHARCQSEVVLRRKCQE